MNCDWLRFPFSVSDLVISTRNHAKDWFRFPISGYSQSQSHLSISFPHPSSRRISGSSVPVHVTWLWHRVGIAFASSRSAWARLLPLLNWPHDESFRCKHMQQTAYTPSTAFRHLPPARKDVVNQCLEFGNSQASTQPDSAVWLVGRFVKLV